MKEKIVSEKKKSWDLFLASVFFVLGFSVVFSLLGVLLQSVLSDVSYSVQVWLGRIGGVVIILFGLYLVGLIKPKFLQREHKIQVKRRFKSMYLTSFVFGAAFAVGWTPCVGAILGAILTLAVSNPGSAFFLLLSYSIGLGVPFLLVGAFTQKASKLISKAGKWLMYVNIVFGIILIVLGVFVYTNQLSRVANLAFATDFLQSLNVGTVGLESGLNIFISFLAGLASFLSPCVLPLVPAFLSFLTAEASRGDKK
jgi:cytochrome c-type biogenesis protein